MIWSRFLKNRLTLNTMTNTPYKKKIEQSWPTHGNCKVGLPWGNGKENSNRKSYWILSQLKCKLNTKAVKLKASLGNVKLN